MYRISIAKKARKELEKVPKKERLVILDAIEDLGRVPRPDGCKKLKNSEYWRIRRGNYRVIYHIEDAVLKVLVVRVGHRKNVYD